MFKSLDYNMLYLKLLKMYVLLSVLYTCERGTDRERSCAIQSSYNTQVYDFNLEKTAITWL